MDFKMKEASNLLQRAIDLENKRRFTESIIYYQEGLRLLLDYCREAPAEDKNRLREKVEKYMTRAEQVKKKVDDEMKTSTYHEELNISDREKGYSYDSLFGRFLKEDVTHVKIEDPYIKANHQLINFLRFCELVVSKCKQVKKIELYTKSGESQEQRRFFDTLHSDLYTNYGILLTIEYSDTIHDRKITLSNGWIIKIGRGLDYFKASSKNSIGSFDMNLRECHETKVDVYFRKGAAQKS